MRSYIVLTVEVDADPDEALDSAGEILEMIPGSNLLNTIPADGAHHYKVSEIEWDEWDDGPSKDFVWAYDEDDAVNRVSDRHGFCITSCKVSRG